MRDFQAGLGFKPADGARHQAQAGYAGAFLARLKQQLIAQTNPQKQLARRHPLADRLGHDKVSERMSERCLTDAQAIAPVLPSLELTAASGGILSGWRQLGDALPRNLDPRMRRANEVSVDGVNEVDVDGRIVIVALYQTAILW